MNKSNNNSDNLQVISIAILIVGIIIGILLAKFIPITTVKSVYSFGSGFKDTVKESFNFLLMFSTWFIFGLISLAVWIANWFMQILENINANLEEISTVAKSKASEEKPVESNM